MSGKDVSLLDWWRKNPWFVLGLDPDAPRMEVERTGQKLLALLAVGSTSAGECDTPFGKTERDEDAVRQALGLLRDPDQRVLCELWARVTDIDDQDTADHPEPWTEAPAAIGWGATWPTRR
jgi:hypothetical protein